MDKNIKLICSISIFIFFIGTILNYSIYEFNIVANEKTDAIEQIKNTSKYNESDYNKLEYDQLSQLNAYNYASKNYDACRIISNIILEKHNQYDKDTILIMIAIYELDGSLEDAIKLTEVLIPLTRGSELLINYNRLSDLYLPLNIDKSIQYLDEALSISNHQDINIYEYYNGNYIKDKIEFLKEIKSKYGNSKSNYKKAIVEDNRFEISEGVKEYLSQ